MGKVTGFLEFDRRTPPKRPAEARVHDYLEIYNPMPDPNQRDVLTIRWEAVDRNMAQDPITLEWSDQALGWVASYRMVNEKGVQDWSATGISFDEAFRIAMRGAAQVLSGNGPP